MVIGITAIFICLATIIAYVGAASRLAYFLSSHGDAPKYSVFYQKNSIHPLGPSILIYLLYYYFEPVWNRYNRHLDDHPISQCNNLRMYLRIMIHDGTVLKKIEFQLVWPVRGSCILNDVSFNISL